MFRLEQVVRNLAFEEYRAQSLLKNGGYYEMPLDPEFPLAIKLFRYNREVYPLHRHERLEVAVLVEGRGYFQIGDRRWSCRAGDVVVVDSLKLHSFQDFQTERSRAVVVTFLPHLVCRFDSLPADNTFLIPFYCQLQHMPPVIRPGDSVRTPVHKTLVRLVQGYFGREPYRNADCKIALLEVLYHLARHFRSDQVAESEVRAQQHRAARFGKLIEYLEHHYPEQISVDKAASIVAMSRSQFTHCFKGIGGGSFVSYLTNVRLNQAVRLLRESDMRVVEVAAAVGFTDQSYFDRRFKQRFGWSPREHRLKARAAAEA